MEAAMRTRSSLLPAALSLILAASTISIAARAATTSDSPVPRLPWLHEGLVLTYTWYAAVAPGNGSYYEEDDHGNMILHGTGQRYSRSTQTGTSGSGWTQIAVACIEGDKVVLASSSYANAGSLGRNAPVPQGTSSSVAPLMDPGDYWMDPAKLATLHSAPGEHVLVTPVDWKSGDNTVNAVRVQVVNGSSYSDHIYDAKSGLCLHVASSSVGAPPKLVGPGDFGRGDTTVTRNDFVSSRDVAIPWAGESAPDWLANVRALHYRGSITSHGSLPTIPNMLALDMEVASHGRNWAQFSATSIQRTQGAPDIPPARDNLAFGNSEFGGLWAGPAALAQLRQGQVLDEDPVTKMHIVVSRVDASSVVIAAANAAGEIDSQYDKRTGMLIASSFYNVLSMQQRTLKLQGHE
jgi:hypothetical protein